jgi:hypothetical protein
MRAHFSTTQEVKEQATFFEKLSTYTNSSSLPYPGLRQPELVAFQMYAISLFTLGNVKEVVRSFSIQGEAQRLIDWHQYLTQGWLMMLVSQPNYREFALFLKWTCHIVFHLTQTYFDFNSAAALLKAIFSPIVFERCGTWTSSLPKEQLQWLLNLKQQLWMGDDAPFLDADISQAEHYVSSLQKMVGIIQSQNGVSTSKNSLQNSPFLKQDTPLFSELYRNEEGLESFTQAQLCPPAQHEAKRVPFVIPWAQPISTFTSHLIESYLTVAATSVQLLTPDMLASPGAEICHELYQTLSQCSLNVGPGNSPATLGVGSNRYLLYGLCQNYVHELIVSHWILTLPYLPYDEIARLFAPRYHSHIQSLTPQPQVDASERTLDDIQDEQAQELSSEQESKLSQAKELIQKGLDLLTPETKEKITETATDLAHKLKDNIQGAMSKHMAHKEDDTNKSGVEVEPLEDEISPKENETAEVEKVLKELGITPGVDQVSLLQLESNPWRDLDSGKERDKDEAASVASSSSFHSCSALEASRNNEIDSEPVKSNLSIDLSHEVEPNEAENTDNDQDVLDQLGEESMDDLYDDEEEEE